MIGVKRPFKLGAPKPPKSAKKKKLLKTTKPIPDPDDATVIANPHAESMVQKPSNLMEDSGFAEMAPPFTEVIEEGDVPIAEQMVSPTKPIPSELELVGQMKDRYRMLLQQAKPDELVEGPAPSLAYLEDKYGHLVEKGFWYDRVVKLASTYHEICEGDVFDKTHADLEQAVGHLVPYTELEKEYLHLMENYKKSRLQIDGRPTLEYLRRHHAKAPAPPSSPEYLPDLWEGEDDVVQEAMEVDRRYVPQEYCPIHEDSKMTCLNADEVYGALLFKCTTPGCSVFYTSTTSEDVRYQLQEAIHPTVHEGLVHADLKCHCDYTPRMKLSQSQKNPGRVFLTCFKKNNPCNYFQWVHWKVRPPQGPMDAFVQKQPRADTYFTAHNTLRWIDVLPHLMMNYNKSFHRSIGMAPLDVNATNEEQVWNRLYKARFRPRRVKKPTLKVGDKVRLQKKHRPFKKAYLPGWTEEVFSVSAIKKGPLPLYKVVEWDGTPIEGTFYEQDLQLDSSTIYNASRDVLGTEVTNVTNGLAFWNKVIHLMNEDVISNSYRLRKTLVDVTDPTPVVYVKESMCPSFRWEGEDLIVNRRGADATDGRQTKDNKLYSCFDIAYEVALQWGFIRVKSDGTVMAGPNLRMTLFEDEITADHPQRVVKVYLRGFANVNGKAIEPQGNLDIPRGDNVPASGSTVYDLMWYYTVGSEKWIRLSGSVEWRLTKLNATYDAIHKHTGKAVMVYTDLQQSTVVGSTKAQLLRQLVVRRGGEAGHTYSEPKHLEWIPVSTRQTDIVEVQLADVDGKLLDLPQGKSLVTVALKQMLY